MNKFLLKLNLQHFAEPAPAEPTPQAAPQQTQQPTTEPAPQPQNQPEININDIVSNISSKINETLNQRLSPIEQRLNQPSREQIEAQNDAIRQQFETDPMAFVKNIQEQAKQEALNDFKNQYDPLIQKTEQLNNRLTWQDSVRQFIAENPEAQSRMSEISQVLQENPGLMSTQNPLDVAYKIALSSNLINGGGNVVQGVLSNEEYRKQIMQDPTLKQAIIQEYQAGLNNGSQQGLPPLMGNQQSGSIPASGGEFPKSLKEARQAALRRFQQQG